MLESFTTVLPMMGMGMVMVMGWLIPAILITWALGMLMLV